MAESDDVPAMHTLRPIYLLGDAESESPRIFVEWWHTKDWPEVQVHLASLIGMTNLVFHPGAVGANHLAFDYRDHRFQIYRGSGDYSGVVDDPSCSDEILYEVANHLNRLLCRIY